MRLIVVLLEVKHLPTDPVHSVKTTELRPDLPVCNDCVKIERAFHWFMMKLPNDPKSFQFLN